LSKEERKKFAEAKEINDLKDIHEPSNKTKRSRAKTVENKSKKEKEDDIVEGESKNTNGRRPKSRGCSSNRAGTSNEKKEN